MTAFSYPVICFTSYCLAFLFPFFFHFQMDNSSSLLSFSIQTLTMVQYTPSINMCYVCVDSSECMHSPGDQHVSRETDLTSLPYMPTSTSIISVHKDPVMLFLPTLSTQVCPMYLCVCVCVCEEVKQIISHSVHRKKCKTTTSTQEPQRKAGKT